MKRRDLIKQLAKAAKARQVSFIFVREGGSHTIYSFGGHHVAIPRHTEVVEHTAQSILREVGIQ
jgi:mRNA interferase HicA